MKGPLRLRIWMLFIVICEMNREQRNNYWQHDDHLLRNEYNVSVVTIDDDEGCCTGIYQVSGTVLSTYTFSDLVMTHFLSEKAMAPHSSTLVWKIPWTEEPGRLQSMGSLRVGHDWATSLSLFTFMHWRRKWQPAPVFLPGESQGWGSLVGCCLWGRTESDTTEAT